MYAYSKLLLAFFSFVRGRLGHAPVSRTVSLVSRDWMIVASLMKTR